jgi:hypothetical protein
MASPLLAPRWLTSTTYPDRSLAYVLMEEYVMRTGEGMHWRWQDRLCAGAVAASASLLSLDASSYPDSSPTRGPTSWKAFTVSDILDRGSPSVNRWEGCYELVDARNALFDVIRCSVEPEEWLDSGGVNASSRGFGDEMIVAAPADMLVRIEGRLDEIRDAMTREPGPHPALRDAPPRRFIGDDREMVWLSYPLRDLMGSLSARKWARVVVDRVVNDADVGDGRHPGPGWVGRFVIGDVLVVSTTYAVHRDIDERLARLRRR